MSTTTAKRKANTKSKTTTTKTKATTKPIEQISTPQPQPDSTAKLPIDKIRTDGGTQPRAELNQAVVEEYAEEKKSGATFPPITTFFDGEDYWLADGFHRFNAERLLESETVEAIVKQGDRREAVLYSVGANASHGLRRTNADKRRAVTRLLEDEEWVKWSNREISRRCGVDDVFVAKLRKELSADGQQIEERIVQRGGTTYTQKTSNINKDRTTNTSKATHSNTDSDTDDTDDDTNSDTNSDSDWANDLQYDDAGNCITLAEVTVKRHPELFGRRCQIKSVGKRLAVLISPIDGKECSYYANEFNLIQPTAQQPTNTFNPHGKPEDRTDEQYTPEYIWKLALECLEIEQFDLDPCSNSHHSPNVPAKNVYTIEDDGLKQDWDAKFLWLNPPYSDTKAWTTRLINEYQSGNIEQAFVLVKCDVSTQWFQPLFDFPICMVNHRIKFENEKNDGNGAMFSSAIVYLGENIEKFYLTFDKRFFDKGIGTVVQAGIRGIHFGE